MNAGRARLLFDECLGKNVVERLVHLVELDRQHPPEIRHVLEFAPPGTRDEDWIPKIASEGWTVITADGGRTPNKNRGEKLPQLCARLMITHIILSPAIHQRNSFEKLLVLLSVWFHLLDIATDEANRGKRYAIEPSQSIERGRGRILDRSKPAGGNQSP